MCNKDRYTIKAAKCYIEYFFKQNDMPVLPGEFDQVDTLWHHKRKLAIYPKNANGKPKEIAYGLFADFESLSRQHITILPSEFVDLINLKRYFDELDKMDKYVHHEDSRENIIKKYDEEMKKILDPFKEGYKGVRRPAFLVLDNNIPKSPNFKTLDENSKKECELWIKIMNNKNDEPLFEEDLKANGGKIITALDKIEIKIEKAYKEDPQNYILIVDIILGIPNYTGIDVIKGVRKKNHFFPIIVVSKHFSDHCIADALVMAKADWFISKGDFKLEELGIISIFLNALRYREYFKHTLLFVKLFLIYEYIKTTKDSSSLISKEIKRINDFVSWIEGADKNKDFPEHKPPFVNYFAEQINDPINRMLEFLEDAIDTQKIIPEETFRTIINEIYKIIERKIEPQKNRIGLIGRDNTRGLIWEIPLNGGIIDIGFIPILLCTEKTVSEELKNLFKDINNETYFYIIWEKLLSNIINDNERWK